MNKKFIKATNKYCNFDEHIPAPCLRRSFQLDFTPETAELSVCGLGFYCLWVNGTEITKGALAPYISNPDHYCYYDTYNVKEFLKEGENVIGIILGNGFFNPFGGFVWEADKASWRGAPRVAVDFFAECGERSICIHADEQFKTYSSPIVFDEMRMGEYYDARLENNGWNKPGFDDSQWSYAILAEIPQGEMKKCIAEPIKPQYELKPVSIRKQSNGWLYDFGYNCAGVCRLKINALSGQKIVLRHGEMLINGEFTIRNIIFNGDAAPIYNEYAQKDIYIASGIGQEVYTPRFTYHGFQYVLVSGITEEQATPELLTYVVMNSDIEHIGGFECSDGIANTLFDMVKRSDLSNLYYFPTDCPHREKNGWTGDAAASAWHMALLYKLDKSWEQWLDNIRKSQTEEGQLPGIVPTHGWGYEWGNGPAWDRVIFELTYQLFKLRGNLQVVWDNAYAMIKYLNYIMTRKNDDGIIAVGLGDWVPVGKEPEAYDCPLALSDSIMVMDIAKKCSEMMLAIGLNEQADFANGVYREMRCVIRDKLINFETVTASGACQTSQALILYYGVLEKDEEEKAFLRLLDFVHEKNDRFDCGYLGVNVLFHVLARFGEAELAYDMITGDGFPSFGRYARAGWTTLPEYFSDNIDTPGSSHNHHFEGDIARWFMCVIAGLDVKDSKHVRISPNFIRQLDYAAAYHILPEGKCEVSWKRSNGEIELKISCPVEYDIEIPKKYSGEKLKVIK